MTPLQPDADRKPAGQRQCGSRPDCASGLVSSGRKVTMFTNLTNSAKAFVFFMIAFGLTVTVSLLYPLLGQLTAYMHMFTPMLSVLIMMLVVTRDGYSKAGWATLGLHRAGLRWWLLALLGPLVVMSAVYGIVWNTSVAHAVF